MQLKIKSFIEFLLVSIREDCMKKTIIIVWLNHRNRKNEAQA
jgi:hypothetical protein